MLKLLRIKKLILLLLLFPLLGISQRLDYVQGEILFQLEEDSKLNIFTSLIEKKYPKLPVSNNLDQVSSSFGIWKLNFDHNRYNELDLLHDIRQLPVIRNAQLNYFTSNRNEPDDPLFSQLWHFKNTGQSGGTFGTDLDATLAWGMTTGGITYNGDTIVLCIIDESFDYNHEDLVDNLWVNHQEIPNNGLDDDGNGYLDDYRGWNVNTDDDEIGNASTADWHGTAISGIAGASGDNSLGTSGLCWNVKLMLVSRGNTTADAISAYTYPFANRKLFNETQGSEGSYIVATNSSWGVNFGTPDDAPLWCAVYDSLGSVGILNTAATINSNYDVDIVGDLPTTCTSDYLITTTSVDHNDVKITDAGFGAESIDLGAFGEDILTTFNNHTYNTITGTSAAAPQVAATIALLHSAPCPDFATLALYEPELAALQLKGYILDGTEANTSLEGITLTGGRLNTNNSLQLLMDSCAYASCYAPFSVNVDSVDISSVYIEWVAAEPITSSVNLEYRAWGSMDWITVTDVESPYYLDNLDFCAMYEFRLESMCNTGIDLYSDIFSFETDGCCHTPQDFSFEATANSIHIQWADVTASLAYQLNFREAGTSTWQDIVIPNNEFILPSLSECQAYEFKVNTICANVQSEFSEVITYTTLGCDACFEADYCNSSGPEESLSWISHVRVDNFNQYSDFTTGGYADYTNQSISLTRGFSHALDLYTDFDFVHFPAFFSVWIDFNQNGIFEANELQHQSDVPETSCSGDLIIPPDALLGSTRMRIAYKEAVLGPCGICEDLGEVEDYCVYISDPTECLPPVNFNHSYIGNNVVLNWSGNTLSDEFLFQYRELGTMEWTEVSAFSNVFILFDLPACTDYEYILTSICDGALSEASPVQFFTTKGCGTCLDKAYCQTLGANPDFEWIESVSLHDFVNNSGPSTEGYTLFSNFNTNLTIGQDHQIQLTPGFANDSFPEVFNVWIDFNQDGSYDDVTEKVLEGFSENGAMISNQVYIPTDALSGSTRMRVSMKYSELINEPCENNFFGEIEEYCVNIIHSGDNICSDPNFNYYYPLDLYTVEVNWFAAPDAISYRLRYRPTDNPLSPWTSFTTSNRQAAISNLNFCENYDLQIQTICESGLSNFGDTQIINTCELVATEEAEATPGVEIFPNPFSRHTNLVYQSKIESSIQVELYSGLGQAIKVFNFNTTIGENTFAIDLGDQISGIYFLKIHTKGELVACKKILNQAP